MSAMLQMLLSSSASSAQHTVSHLATLQKLSNGAGPGILRGLRAKSLA